MSYWPRCISPCSRRLRHGIQSTGYTHNQRSAIYKPRSVDCAVSPRLTYGENVFIGLPLYRSVRLRVLYRCPEGEVSRRSLLQMLQLHVRRECRRYSRYLPQNRRPQLCCRSPRYSLRQYRQLLRRLYRGRSRLRGRGVEYGRRYILSSKRLRQSKNRQHGDFHAPEC